MSQACATVEGVRRLSDGRGMLAVSSTTAGILAGELDVSEWTDEELIRGQRKDNWSGRPPTVVPSAIHSELVKRRMSKAYDLLRTNARRAVAVLVEVATDKKAPPAIRVQAATEILDRTLGKPTERMELDVDVMKPWQRLIASSVVGMSNGRLVGVVGGIVGSDEQARQVELEALEAEVLSEETSDDDGEASQSERPSPPSD
jgi:hypothetical protein